jgi:hypothetical protein
VPLPPTVTVLDLGLGEQLFERSLDPRLRRLRAAGLQEGQRPDLVALPVRKPRDLEGAVQALAGDLGARLLREGTGLVFDASGERWPFTGEQFDLLDGALERIGAAPGRAVLITQNRCCAADYARHCAAHGRRPMAVLTHDYWIHRLFVERLQTGPDQLAERMARFEAWPAHPSRRFVCLNYAPRVSKVLVLMHLLRDKLWDQGHVSFGGFSGPDLTLSKLRRHMSSDPHFGGLAEANLKWLYKLDRKGRILFVDDDATPSKTLFAGEAALPQFYDSAFSVVTESEMTDRPYRITEKPFNALLNFHPIVLFGNPGSLALIRELGFRTFGEAIDERYDEEADPVRRFEMAYGEVRRLCGMDDAAMAAMRARLSETLVHNAEWGLTRLPAIYRDEIDPAIIDEVMAVVGAGA